MKDFNTDEKGTSYAYVRVAKKIEFKVSSNFTIQISPNIRCYVEKIRENLYNVKRYTKGGLAFEWMVTAEELNLYFSPR
jgi:hypothetical protein